MRLRDFELTLPPELRWENLTLANDFLFDCEVQTSDKKDLPRRTRAYHSIMGLEALNTNLLKTSGSYNNMPDAFVIFICMFDPFGLGRHIYTFRNSCKEVNGLYLDDGAVTIFLNAHGKSDDISAELKAFLDFMLGKPSGDPFIKILSEQIKIAKLNAKWRQVYMRNMLYKCELLAEGRAEGRIEGLTEGRTEARSEMLNALNELMRSNIISPEQVNAIKAAALKS